MIREKTRERRENRRRFFRMLRQSFKVGGADIIFKGYLGYFVFVAFMIWVVEPSIKTFFDSIWYCFAVATTVGFGDIAATSLLGRAFTIILSIYSIGAVAIFTAIIAGFFMDLAKVNAADSAREFLYEMEHLPELSREELQALSDKVKSFVENR